jgi:hypothetical protein
MAILSEASRGVFVNVKTAPLWTDGGARLAELLEEFRTFCTDLCFWVDDI